MSTPLDQGPVGVGWKGTTFGSFFFPSVNCLAESEVSNLLDSVGPGFPLSGRALHCKDVPFICHSLPGISALSSFTYRRLKCTSSILHGNPEKLGALYFG